MPLAFMSIPRKTTSYPRAPPTPPARIYIYFPWVLRKGTWIVSQAGLGLDVWLVSFDNITRVLYVGDNSLLTILDTHLSQ